MLKVRRVEGRRDLGAFVDLPFRLHRHDPVWVPPLRYEVRSRLDRRRNPFFDHGEAEYFLAERDGRVVGRIAAIVNRLHNEVHGDRTAFFGFFESENDPPVASALLEQAARWARERGFDTLRGPTSFSTNDECGVLVHGFDRPPTLLLPHNPPYYADLLEAAGFVKAKDLLVFEGDRSADTSVPERVTRALDRIGKRTGVRVRVVERRDFAAEVRRLQEAFNLFWEKNWGYVPMTDREISHLAREFKPIYVPELVPFAEKDGRIVAVALAMPDLNEVLRFNRNGRLLPAIPRVLWALRRRKLKRMRLMLLGIVPEFRGKGVDALVIHQLWTAAVARGIEWCEAGWILEDNLAMGNSPKRLGFEHYKTFRLYDRAL